MAEPNRLHVKRKITEDAPDYLILHSDVLGASHVRYVKKHKSKETAGNSQEAGFAQPQHHATAGAAQQPQRKKRVFHLKPELPRVTGKRGRGEESIATFVEENPQQPKKSKQDAAADPAAQAEQDVKSDTPAQPSTPLKRPGRGSAVKSSPSTAMREETEAERLRLEQLADYLHEATLEELKRESKPKPVVAPKLSGARSRELHQQRMVSDAAAWHTQDGDRNGEEDYVYETYVLAPTTDESEPSVELLNELGKIGYLVVKEEDESLWEKYREDDPGDVDWYSDDEDENAEDYYGADYPEDEVSSDDEFDRNPYDYRGNASDEEQYDDDTGSYSDNEYDKTVSSFNLKTPQHFSKALEDDD